jgi:hypothetical protein
MGLEKNLPIFNEPNPGEIGLYFPLTQLSIDGVFLSPLTLENE